MAIISLIRIFNNTEQRTWLDASILIIFFLYVLLLFIRADDKWKFIVNHPFELIALIPLSGVFQGAMTVRLIRLLLLTKIIKKHFPQLSRILMTNNLNRVLVFTLVMIIIAAIPISYLEEDIHSVSEGIWWAIVTTTTVGYGDMAPATPLGRLIAILLMMIGIGCIGMITGSVASYLSSPTGEDEDKMYIKNKIDQLEKLSPDEYSTLLSLIDNKRKASFTETSKDHSP